MTATAAPVILALLCAGAATADPGWPVGWGFEAHGGFPPLPPAWQTYSLQKSTVGFFLGNATGMDSAAELDSIELPERTEHAGALGNAREEGPVRGLS